MWGFLPRATAGPWSGVPAPRDIRDASRGRASSHPTSKESPRRGEYFSPHLKREPGTRRVG
eukprot:92047-Pleurochrysis_carterae.AAC.1